MNKFKWLSAITISSALSASVFLAGCSSQKIVLTTEDAPNELMKEVAGISTTSSAEEIQAVLSKLTEATKEQYKDGYQTSETTHAIGLNVQDDELNTNESNFKNFDIRFGKDQTFYELYEEESGDEANYGLMAYHKNNITTVFGTPDGAGQFANEHGKFVVQTINQEDGQFKETSDKDMDSYIDQAIAFPLDHVIEGNLLVSPFDHPEAYSFKLEESGDNYIWTITIADQESYNETLNSTFSTVYGYDRVDVKGDGSFILDEFTAQEVTYSITMNENGAVTQIDATNRSEALKDGKRVQLNGTDTLTLKTVDEKWHTFFADFFDAIHSGSLKEGDSFTLLQTFENKDSEKASQSTETSTAESEASSKEVSKEDSKVSSESKADTKTSSASSSQSTK